MNVINARLQFTGPGLRRGLAAKPWAILLVLSVICWVYFLVTASSSVAGHAHHHSGDNNNLHFFAGISAWLVMVYAMMLPLQSASLRYMLCMLPRYQHYNSLLLFIIGYSSVWLLIGLTLIFATQFSAAFFSSTRLAVPALALPIEAAVFLLAALYNQTPYRRQAVFACGGGLPLRINGWQAAGDVLYFGVYKGRNCAASCLHVMLALVFAGHNLVMMAVVTLALFYERARLPRETKIVSYLCYLASASYLFVWLYKV